MPRPGHPPCFARPPLTSRALPDILGDPVLVLLHPDSPDPGRVALLSPQKPSS